MKFFRKKSAITYWITTNSDIKRRSPRGSVDWNSKKFLDVRHLICRSPRGSVDWNLYAIYSLVKEVSLPTWECGLKLKVLTLVVHVLSRSPRGSVDWNFERAYLLARSNVAPHVGVWIETIRISFDFWSFESLPTWECGLKPFARFLFLSLLSRSPRGSVDWN